MLAKKFTECSNTALKDQLLFHLSEQFIQPPLPPSPTRVWITASVVRVYRTSHFMQCKQWYVHHSIKHYIIWPSAMTPDHYAMCYNDYIIG